MKFFASNRMPTKCAVIVALVLSVSTSTISVSSAFAAAPVEVRMQTGKGDRPFAYHPDHLDFERNTAYRLVIDNPNTVNHAFSSPEFAKVVNTSKLVRVQAGVETDIRASVSNFQIPAKSTIIWEFTTPNAPHHHELICTVPGHEETGMGGKLNIR